MTMPMTARATSTTAITSSIAAVPRYSGSWSDIPLHVTLCSNDLVECNVLGKVVSAQGSCIAMRRRAPHGRLS
jgi:hypothetical protein